MYNVLNIDDINIAINNDNLDENKKIVNQLFTYLAHNKIANSLSNNQLGIDGYRVGVVFVKRPIYFINPYITAHGTHTIEQVESCITFPNKLVTTKRYDEITITADNLNNPLTFNIPQNVIAEDKQILRTEIVAIQRMIDMLDKITMFDRQKDLLNVNRNDYIIIIKGETELRIKNKYLHRFNKKGWSLKK